MDSFRTGPEFISGMRSYMGASRDSSLKTLSGLLEKNPQMRRCTSSSETSSTPRGPSATQRRIT